MIKNKIRKCNDCGEDKLCKDFYHLGGTRNNISKYCLVCHENRLKIEQTKLDLFNKGLKICVKCKETKQLFMFHNNRTSNDGKNCYCKPCAKIVNKQYPVNKDLKLANKQRYRFKNREFINKRQSEIRKINRFRFMCHTANLRAKKVNQLNRLTPLDLWRIAKRQKLKCALSGVKLTNNNISLDHIIPFSRGGTNTVDNIQLLDNTVNLMKGTFLQDNFLEAIRAIYMFTKQETKILLS